VVEVAKFATLWVPICHKHCIEPRAPENYFELELPPLIGRASEEFVNDYKWVQMEYDNFKFRLDNLPGTILKRSDVYNSIRTPEGDAQVTWMANGTQWPGTWIDPTENHRKGDYMGIVKVLKFRLLVLDFLISSMYFLWNFCF
jgi:hypothetical protein